MTAWAGDSLLLHHDGGAEDLSVWVADGPGAIRHLARGFIVAASPDGQFVLVSDPSAGRDVPATTLYEVSTGSEVATIDVQSAQPLMAFGTGGHWQGDRIIVGSTTDAGPAVTELLVDDGTIRIGRSVELPLHPIGANEPLYLPESSDLVVFSSWRDTPEGIVTLIVTCDLGTELCTTIDEVPTGHVWQVRNPSVP